MSFVRYTNIVTNPNELAMKQQTAPNFWYTTHMQTTDPNTVASGLLDVGDGHQIYWEDWGSRTATPIIHLHGGPGAGFSDKHKVLYDPTRHRVIFHDQRGCGKSLPFAETARNTTQDLIADIERLRTSLGIEKAYVSGGSWGSSLSLLYAIAHPERVIRLMIWSVFLCRQSEDDYLNAGYARCYFPEAWERFIANVPAEQRGTGDDIAEFYRGKLHDADPDVARRFAYEWCLWEGSLLSLSYDKATVEAEASGDESNLAIARLETHYFHNGCFVEEGYILNNLDRIRHIPLAILHGRFDMCTPAISAWDLYQAYGPNATLQWVSSGHLRTEPAMLTALKATANAVLV